jgi:hypothetical protein
MGRRATIWLQDKRFIMAINSVIKGEKKKGKDSRGSETSTTSSSLSGIPRR